MFAIDHAATALVVRRRFPSVPLWPLLIGVQLMELAWVLLNVLGVEHLTTDATVKSVANVHLSDMPWSHSLAGAVALSFLAAMVAVVTKHRQWAWPIAFAVFSHFILDAVTHDHDLAIAPGLGGTIGLGLYGAAPMVAFAGELLYGLWCWWFVRGSRWLLVAIVGFNVANLSFLSPAIPGPEALMAGRPMLVVGVVAVQIAVTLWLVARLAPVAASTRSA